jgi:hypothetical protein
MKSVEIIRERWKFNSGYMLVALVLGGFLTFLPFVIPPENRVGAYVIYGLIWGVISVICGFADGKEEYSERVKIREVK